MKKLVLLVPLIFLLASCEEDFDPKTTYKPKFALNCILRGDTTLQFATIVKSYTVSGFDPYENTVAEFVSGADVRIWQKNKVYIMRDTLVPRTDTSRYKDPIPCYYINNFEPGENDSIEIRAILTDGKALSGASRMPPTISFSSQSSDFLVPLIGQNYFSYSWIKQNSTSFFMPKVTISYAQKIGGEKVRKTILLPMEIKMQNGVPVPVYPGITRSGKITFYQSALDSVFKQISAGDPEKGNYYIIGAVLDLLEFDEPLSAYYSSMKGFLDDLTIRVDENDYTNITGGFGIFGSYLKPRHGISFTDSYIHSFGYKTFIEK